MTIVLVLLGLIQSGISCWIASIYVIAIVYKVPNVGERSFLNLLAIVRLINKDIKHDLSGYRKWKSLDNSFFDWYKTYKGEEYEQTLGSNRRRKGV